MKNAVENVGGVPQHVFKIPLDAKLSPAIGDLDIAKLIERVIVGPSSYPWVVHQAFVDELTKAGVPKAEEKVFVSGIPIRTGL